MNRTGELVPSAIEVILKKRPRSSYPRVVATGKPWLYSGWLRRTSSIIMPLHVCIQLTSGSFLEKTSGELEA